MKLKKTIEKLFTEAFVEIKRQSKNRLFNFAFLNTLIILFQVAYITFRKFYVNTEIPFWYTKLWGDYQLAPKAYLLLIPAIAILLTILGVILMAVLNKYFVRFISEVITSFITFSNVILTFEVVQIINRASIPFKPFIDPVYMAYLPYGVLAFFAVYFFTPIFISFAKEHNIVTNPLVHIHPAMILKSPSARGGGVIYTVAFLVLGLIFLGFPDKLIGLYVSLFLLAILSLADDYQNTHPHSSFKVLENPVIRLILLCSIVSIIAIGGIRIDTVNNPLNQFINGQFIQLSGNQVVASAVTIIWIVWLMNVLSWSNGIDGQFSGIVGIASLVVAVLSLRFTELNVMHKQVATLAVISAGAAFGLTRYTWHPSKIMWGFGAMSAGLILATLSILSQTKVITSILIILLPFLDAVVTLLRRLFQGKNPLRGDRNHLHHILLDRGWSVTKIAVFYWVTTGILGLIGLLTAERYTLQAALILGGIIAFFIILMNVGSLKRTSHFHGENSSIGR